MEGCVKPPKHTVALHECSIKEIGTTLGLVPEPTPPEVPIYSFTYETTDATTTLADINTAVGGNVLDFTVVPHGEEGQSIRVTTNGIGNGSEITVGELLGLGYRNLTIMTDDITIDNPDGLTIQITGDYI